MACPTDINQIARGLSDAQREMVRTAEAHGPDGKGQIWLARTSGMGMDVRFFAEQREGLRKRGLTLYWNPNYDTLTAKGLALRTHLLVFKGLPND